MSTDWNLANIDYINSNNEKYDQFYSFYKKETLPRLEKLPKLGDRHVDLSEIETKLKTKEIQTELRVYELSIWMTHQLINVDELYISAKEIIADYCTKAPITEDEAEVIFNLMALHLIKCVEMGVIDGASSCLEKLSGMDPYFLNAVARNAAGYSCTREYNDVINWITSDECNPAPLFTRDIHNEKDMILYFGKDQAHLDFIFDADKHQKYVEDLMKENDATYAIGLYGEDRGCYQSEIFQSLGCDEKRSVHLGLDIFIEAEEELRTPLSGKVYSVKYNAASLDYGYTVILEHEAGNTGTKFYTLYGHLSHRTCNAVSEGDMVEAGQIIGYIGQNHENGGWSPHLHFQIMTNMLSCEGDFYGACEAKMWELWSEICPDPNILMQIDPNKFQ